jgi:hypothetical protein
MTCDRRQRRRRRFRRRLRIPLARRWRLLRDLLAGDYVLHLVFDDDGADPPYFLQLSGRIGAIGATEEVPEPTSLMLLWAAALALFATRLRRARRCLH